MSEQERKAFEKRFPVPGGIFWNEVSEQYDAEPGSGRDELVEIYHGQWVAWQAARAQAPASGEVEPVYQLKSKLGGGWDDVSKHEYESAHESYVRRTVTHPPASQVPEGDELKALLNDAVESGYRYGLGRGHMPDEPRRGIVAEIMEGAATTPEATGGGWIKCDERLPTEADEDFEGRVWLCWPYRDLVERVTRRTTSFCDGFWWKPTGLRKPTPPTAQEGE